MSLYDRLNNRLGSEDDDQGSGSLTPLDIADLPPGQRKVMFSLLRDTKAATEGVTLARLEEKLENPPNLIDSVTELVRSGWLIELGEGEAQRFKVNLRRKRSSSLGFGIWSSLSERITSRMQELEDMPSTPRVSNLPQSFTTAKSSDAEKPADSDDDTPLPPNPT
jgi:hypothetical protein